MKTPEEILRGSKTIALVGASPNPDRPSHSVMRYLLGQGYHVIPVRPLTCDEVLGVPCVATLADIDEPIDLVDVFRREDAAPGHAREAVGVGAKAFWLQLDLHSPEARRIATEAGLDYVEDACTAVVHRQLINRGAQI
jgi:predicted CoA-binding protein